MVLFSNLSGSFGVSLCGFSLPDPYQVLVDPGSEFYITFTSDSNEQYEGFAVEVTFQDASTITATVPPVTTTTTPTPIHISKICNQLTKVKQKHQRCCGKHCTYDLLPCIKNPCCGVRGGSFCARLSI